MTLRVHGPWIAHTSVPHDPHRKRWSFDRWTENDKKKPVFRNTENGVRPITFGGAILTVAQLNPAVGGLHRDTEGDRFLSIRDFG